MNFTAAGQSNSKEVDESIFQYICCLLLRHITQLVCNGHAIYDVGACDTGMYIFFRSWVSKVGQVKKMKTPIYQTAPDLYINIFLFFLFDPL